MMTAVEDPVLKGSDKGVYLIEGELPAEALSPPWWVWSCPARGCRSS